MPITKETPLVIPAKEERTLPHTWVSNLTVSVESSSQGYMFLELIPYNSESDEPLKKHRAYSIHCDFWEVINEVPEAAAALQAVYAAIPAIESYYAAGILEEETVGEPMPDEIPATE